MFLFYFVCRPSELSHCSSIITLFEAFKLEVREGIRRLGRPRTDQTPLHSILEEIEVCTNAKFLAKHKLEEQKNLEFYIWYKSEWPWFYALLIRMFFDDISIVISKFFYVSIILPIRVHIVSPLQKAGSLLLEFILGCSRQ